MIRHEDTERRLDAWLGSLPPVPDPDLLADVLAAVAERPQRHPVAAPVVGLLHRADRRVPRPWFSLPALDTRTRMTVAFGLVLAGLLALGVVGALLRPAPFGGGLLALATDQGLMISTPDFATRRVLVDDPTIDVAAWSHDGRRIAIRRHLGGSVLGRAIVSVVDAATGAEVDLTDPMLRPDTGGSVAWTPDDSTLVFVGETNGNLAVVAADTRTGANRRVLSQPINALDLVSVTSDGSHVVFLATPTGRGMENFSIHVVGIDGRDERVLPFDEGAIRWYALSPDDRIAYCRARFGEAGSHLDHDVRVGRLDGTSADVLVGPTDDCAVEWSRAGNALAILRDGSMVGLIDVPSGDVRTSTADATVGIWFPSTHAPVRLSPDARWALVDDGDGHLRNEPFDVTSGSVQAPELDSGGVRDLSWTGTTTSLP